ncbi:Rad9-domain-containing protein [Gloeopeniophorella convolvens]|nr:Rad9-domain-containing protein [Gloeopeniophorella convolvens]
MQASIDASALKSFTRALTCMSKYSEELSIGATPDSISFSATNTSLSAYCRFSYDRSFFIRYNVGDRSVRDAVPELDNTEQTQTVTGQLCVQPLLAILKHKTLEKTVDRIDFVIVDGVSSPEDEDHDSLESRLILRLHCKHGIVKTHRLLLQAGSGQLQLHEPEALNESHVVIGPKAMKDMIDHFPSTRGKADPQLIWVFDDTEVHVRSLENSLDKGTGQLATELTISADEFESYDMFATPISLAFHLREFNATIAYADAMDASIDMRFTDPGTPLYVEVRNDGIECLFAVSTNSAPGAPAPAPVRSQSRPAGTPDSAQGQARKRLREESPARPRAPARIVERIKPSALTRRVVPEQRAQGSLLPAPAPGASMGPPPLPASARTEPLFLPGSQMSAADEAALRASGLGEMDADEFNAMMEDEGEEVGFHLGFSDPPAPSPPPLDVETHETEAGHAQDADLYEQDDIDSEMGPTQSDEGAKHAFRPLFDD